MKWVTGFLLVLNAAMFLWATGHDPGRQSSAAAYPVVSGESMRLLSEVKAERESDSEDRRRCARIGPFASSSVAAVAAQKLDEMSLSYRRRTVKSREIRAFRVFLGPLRGEPAIETQRRLLDSGGVEDYYVKRDESGGAIISLGLYSQRDGAEAMLRRLARNDIQANLRTEERVLEPNYWLEIDDPALDGRIPQELTGASWGEQEARVRRYDCR